MADTRRYNRARSPIPFASAPGASDTGYPESQVGYVVNAAGDLTFYRYLGTDAGGDAVWREDVHLNDDGELVGPILLEEYTIAELGDFVPTEGELILDEDGGLRIGDGSTDGDELVIIGPARAFHATLSGTPTQTDPIDNWEFDWKQSFGGDFDDVAPSDGSLNTAGTIWTASAADVGLWQMTAVVTVEIGSADDYALVLGATLSRDGSDASVASQNLWGTAFTDSMNIVFTLSWLSYLQPGDEMSITLAELMNTGIILDEQNQTYWYGHRIR